MAKEVPFPPDIKGHTEETYAVREALGRAISSWARVEGAVSDLFITTLRPRYEATGSAVFAAVKGFEIRRDMTDAAIRMTFRFVPEILTEWDSLKKALDKLRIKRNRLAHGQIIKHGLLGKSFFQVEFVPFYYLEHHHGFESFKKLSRSDLIALSREFKNIAAELKSFSEKVRHSKAPQSKPREQRTEDDASR